MANGEITVHISDLYQQLAWVTANKELSPDYQLMNGALGLCGESGEVADIIKKTWMQGHELDKDHLIEQIGDVMWYIALLCTALDVKMSDVQSRNIRKLAKRYPEGFASERSVKREC